MNIFVIYEDPYLAAIHQIDKHVVKMPLESAQMLCSALMRHSKGAIGLVTPYKKAYIKHPCTLWAGDTRSNFDWLFMHGIYLCQEYTRRYNKVHASEEIIAWCGYHSTIIPAGKQTPHPLCMPLKYRKRGAVRSYRAFYKGDKKEFATWKANKPSWW